MKLNRERFIRQLEKIHNVNDLAQLKKEIATLQKNLLSDSIAPGLLHANTEEEAVEFNTGYLSAELHQIFNTRTLERARYYLMRLLKTTRGEKTGKVNDIDLNRWKEYEDIITDSLWIFDRRDRSGTHTAGYWGNFIPQIPNQLIRRYTKKGEWVLDTFLGSGTTLIECRRLGRNGIGIELQPEVAEKAKAALDAETQHNDVATYIVTGDSAAIDYHELTARYGIKSVQLVLMHPPYWDIIEFSRLENDLSLAKDLNQFLIIFGKIVDKATAVLDKDRYLAVVIGDKFEKGEWLPLGFYCMQEVLKRQFTLKATIVKNFEDTRSKRQQKEIWRYRALAGGFYIFKHEYIFLFKKRL
jgi:hypothetical protein